MYLFLALVLYTQYKPTSSPLSTEKTVVATVMSNIGLEISLEKEGIALVRTDVGDRNVVDEMLLLDSPIGGEGSNGGVIIPPSRCRDGILSILYLSKIINNLQSERGLYDHKSGYY